MSDDLIRKMTQAYLRTTFGFGYGDNVPVEPTEMDAMRAALRVLAGHFDNEPSTIFRVDGVSVRATRIVAAAIREAAR